MSKNLPPLPPSPNEEKQTHELTHLLYFERLEKRLRQSKLNASIQLAMEAARGEGILVEHFVELGRRFGSSTAKHRPRTRDKLRLIRGGKN